MVWWIGAFFFYWLFSSCFCCYSRHISCRSLTAVNPNLIYSGVQVQMKWSGVCLIMKMMMSQWRCCWFIEPGHIGSILFLLFYQVTNLLSENAVNTFIGFLCVVFHFDAITGHALLVELTLLFQRSINGAHTIFNTCFILLQPVVSETQVRQTLVTVLLMEYFKSFELPYGPEHCTSNAHICCHLKIIYFIFLLCHPFCAFTMKIQSLVGDFNQLMDFTGKATSYFWSSLECKYKRTELFNNTRRWISSHTLPANLLQH